MTYRTYSAEETKKIAADFAAKLGGGETILLEGELGSGKTTFVQGLVEALGGGDVGRSPTFSIMNVYEAGGINKIVHLDFYRMKDPKELLELGLEEWLGRKDAVVVIEWPPKELIVSGRAYRIRFLAKDASTRQIDIQEVS